jgi:hypothetical protein
MSAPLASLDSGDNAKDSSEEEQCYRLVSIDAVSAPKGCAGRDWFVYRILQGDNAITGYRRGDRTAVGAEVETIVSALNGRRMWPKSKRESRVRRGDGAAGATPSGVRRGAAK